MINEHMYKAEKPVLGARMALGAPRRPPTYRRMLRKKYLAVAKAKKHPTKRTRSLIRVLLCAVKRNKGFVNAYFEKGAPFSEREERRRAKRARRKDDADRIEVERFFSRDKRYFGSGLIRTKLSKTTLGCIALSVLVANLFNVSPSFLSFISRRLQTASRPSISWRCLTTPPKLPDPHFQAAARWRARGESPRLRPN